MFDLISVESETTSETELEYTIYAIPVSINDIIDSDYKRIIQTQYTKLYPNFNTRVRKEESTTHGDTQIKYEHTNKFWGDGDMGVTEVNTDIAEETYSAVAEDYGSGWLKCRILIPIPDTEHTMEVDIFYDGNEIYEWVKVDIEVDKPLSELPPLPFDVSESFLRKHDTTENDDILDKIHNDVLITHEQIVSGYNEFSELTN